MCLILSWERVAASTDSVCDRYGTLLTEQERRMIAERRFTDLTQYQRRIDAEIDAQVLFVPLRSCQRVNC